MSEVELQPSSAENWRRNLIDDPQRIADVLAMTRRIAVIGIKTQAQADQPAFYVPEYLLQAGFDIIPVPVYYPEVVEILGRRVYRNLAGIPGEIDLVNVFRRSGDVAHHTEEILARQPRAVWMQLGIRNEAVAERLAKAGIKVVQDRCLMVDHRRYGRRAI